ncbi:MAG: YraN family protein [Bacteroidales bacterium]|nr:YraN family protein [Bacteroidales bacterium]
MAKHNILGNKGEQAAAEYLAGKSYKILARNKRYGHLEIDIIAEYRDMIIFVEVKSRSGTYFEQPFQAVTIKKQKKIIKAANIYIEENEIDLEARFDIISIVEQNGKFQIEHIEDAFYPLV